MFKALQKTAGWAIKDIHTQTQAHYPKKHIPANSTYIFSYFHLISYLVEEKDFSLVSSPTGQFMASS